tara:strand:- start:143 stop:940 length:798 start_codon:yes stop_codon:yes gene_type:complete
MPVLLALSACTSVPLQQGGGLSSYENLGKETGTFGNKRTFVDKAAVAAVKTVRILPSVYAPKAANRVKRPQDRALVSNVLDRALCVALSDKYQIVGPDHFADMTVHNVITDLVPTNKAVAGVSAVVTAGTGFVLPVSVPRLPLGLGAVAVEGEAVDKTGTQIAAILWSKGANSITNSPRVSAVGDAYSLATSYGSDFSTLLIKEASPSIFAVTMPSGQKIRSYFGGKPKYAACDTFGRAPGLAGMAAGMIAAPPGWADAGRKAHH